MNTHFSRLCQRQRRDRTNVSALSHEEHARRSGALNVAEGVPPLLSHTIKRAITIQGASEGGAV